LITNKFTAYGLTVAVAFAAAVVLLLASAPLGASADKGTTADAAVTITDTAPTNVVTIKGTHVSGLESCQEGTFAVSSPVNLTQTAPADNACADTDTTVTATATATDTTITVGSTTGFAESGSLIIDNGADGDASDDATELEIVNYTGKTKTSFTGVTRAQAGTTALALVVGANVYQGAYSQVTVLPVAATDTTINVTNAGSFVGGGTTPAELHLLGGTAEVVTVTAISGNTLTISAAGQAHAVGSYVAQIVQVNTDSATTTITPSTGATEGSFKYTLTANGQTSTAGTVSLTILSGKPAAADTEVTVAATLPTPVPVIIALSGTDVAEAFANQAFTLTSLPTKGVLGTITTPICSNVTPVVVGETVSSCTAQVVYTPLLGATGNDSFQYTFTNGATPDTSAAATVTIVLPGGSGTVTPGAGFSTEIVAGFNISQYNGGTVAQMAADAAAAGATTVSVTVEGGFLTYVVGAPAFVNAAFEANFPDGIPAGTGVLVIVGS